MGVMKRLLAEQKRKIVRSKINLPDRDGYFARNGDELLSPAERKKLLADYKSQQRH